MKKQTRAIDMTRGSILRCIFLFTLPLIIGNLLQELYSVFDTMIVGRTLGVVQLAAVGITGSLTFFAMGFTMGNANGCSVMTAQRLGAGDREGVERSIAAHYVISLVEAVFLTGLFVALTVPLLRMLNTGSDMMPYSTRYLRIIYAGLPATILYNMLSSTLRAVGDSRTPLLFLAVSSLLNIILDFVFILVFHWDVAGAAFATILSQLISGIACFIYTMKRFPELIPSRKAFTGIWKEVATALKVGIPMGLNMSVTAAGIVILARVLNQFGSSAVAAHTICTKIQRLMETLMWSVSTAVSTFVGQNYGARRYDRIRTGMKKVTLISLIYLIVFPALAYVFRSVLIRIFIGDGGPEVLAYTEQYLRWMCPTMWLLSFLHIYRGGNIGLGNGNASLLSGISELIARGAFTPLLAPLLGFTAICITGPMAWLFCALLGITLFTIKLKKQENAVPQTDFSET